MIPKDGNRYCRVAPDAGAFVAEGVSVCVIVV